MFRTDNGNSWGKFSNGIQANQIVQCSPNVPQRSIWQVSSRRLQFTHRNFKTKKQSAEDNFKTYFSYCIKHYWQGKIIKMSELQKNTLNRTWNLKTWYDMFWHRTFIQGNLNNTCTLSKQSETNWNCTCECKFKHIHLQNLYKRKRDFLLFLQSTPGTFKMHWRDSDQQIWTFDSSFWSGNKKTKSNL